MPPRADIIAPITYADEIGNNVAIHAGQTVDTRAVTFNMDDWTDWTEVPLGFSSVSATDLFSINNVNFGTIGSFVNKDEMGKMEAATEEQLNELLRAAC